jgi:hypothetical protein
MSQLGNALLVVLAHLAARPGRNRPNLKRPEKYFSRQRENGAKAIFFQKTTKKRTTKLKEQPNPVAEAF